jgi:hypothetical protein
MLPLRTEGTSAPCDPEEMALGNREQDQEEV